ncbi:uncharacterized protein NPIL_584361 [Nephila pilipes]|uniref:Uncharacterized protein n=1 Tax=Nephila pilipes TaxID=299642 RepID=A0A8X6PAH2_NEPPI|nr:uncharacterized protein NPIL_584361 [Nephila pilipes]
MCGHLNHYIKKENILMGAYVAETNSCKTLVDVMSEKDFMQFKKGKPSVHGLTHAHSYPINVQCHNGKRDPKGRWCICNQGWDSAPFDHKNFNPDVQVYHMCTVWMGKLTAEIARNITVMSKNYHKITTAVIFSLLAVSFLLLVSLLVFFIYRQKPWKDDSSIDDAETIGLTQVQNESETE